MSKTQMPKKKKTVKELRDEFFERERKAYAERTQSVPAEAPAETQPENDGENQTEGNE